MYNDRKSHHIYPEQDYVETHIDNKPSFGCVLFAIGFIMVIILGMVASLPG